MTKPNLRHLPGPRTELFSAVPAMPECSLPTDCYPASRHPSARALECRAASQWRRDALPAEWLTGRPADRP